MHKSPTTSLKILVSGGTGLVGRAAVKFLRGKGHDVKVLSRSKKNSDNLKNEFIFWNPASGELDSNVIENFDVIIHLAGESIATGRWTAKKKKEIFDSRVSGTRLLANSILKLKSPPKTFISASAVGIYGNRGREVLDENSTAGDGFLAETGVEWEKSANIAASVTRVINFRIGVVLTRDGGMLGRILLPFKLGLGGVLGSGSQILSWIGIDDLTSLIYHCILTGSISGPLNAVSPNPVTNYEFTKTLGAILNRPTVAKAPGILLRIIFGEFAEDVLLAGQNVKPTKALESGFKFCYPELRTCLEHLTHAEKLRSPNS